MTLAEVIDYEEDMSDSGQYREGVMSITYDGVEISNHSATLTYVSDNSGTQVAMMYTVKDVEEDEILKDIEDKLGEGEKKQDIALNYVWYDEGYKYNLIYVDGEAILTISDSD